MRPARRLDLLVQEIGEEVVILDRVANKVHQLNPSAGCIWKNCDGSCSVEEIIARLASQFELTPEQVSDDVLKTIAEFKALGLLAVESE
jgi:hypothetical protein